MRQAEVEGAAGTSDVNTLSILQRIRVSVFPGSGKTELERDHQRKIFRGFLLHFRPAVVPERTLKLSLTWGLGGMAVVLVFLLFGTGLLLKFAYQPSPERAYDSIVYLNNQIPFGQLLRNLHRWSGNGLLFIVFLHLLRVFYTGAFTAPRQFNWIIGLVLFTAVIFSNFTGYLLPWDQLAYWAITISTSMLDYIPGAGSGLKAWVLGGQEPGSATLMNFYALHTIILPVALLFFLPFHFWRIRMAKGLVIPRSPEEDPSITGDMVESMPHLIIREVVITLLLFAVILLIAIFFDAPLADKANPGLSPNPTKAPWYFMGVQELLMHFHPLFALLVIPGLVTAWLVSIPYINYEAHTSGVWFCSRRGRKMTLVAFAIAVPLTAAAVLFNEYVMGVNTTGPASLMGNGLLPFTVLLVTCIGFYVLLKKAFSATSNEAMQALFTFLVTSFVVLTVIGVWFRGPGMQLMWSA